mmetsp:Transcript_45809/g.90241  ORF Transcript_45809/g.90241 Transcript_45809/m.90241 type:complete len:247 (-) Transcript_45809:338-1078(-)
MALPAGECGVVCHIGLKIQTFPPRRCELLRSHKRKRLLPWRHQQNTHWEKQEQEQEQESKAMELQHVAKRLCGKRRTRRAAVQGRKRLQRKEVRMERKMQVPRRGAKEKETSKKIQSQIYSKLNKTRCKKRKEKEKEKRKKKTEKKTEETEKKEGMFSWIWTVVVIQVKRSSGWPGSRNKCWRHGRTSPKGPSALAMWATGSTMMCWLRELQGAGTSSAKPGQGKILQFRPTLLLLLLARRQLKWR